MPMIDVFCHVLPPRVLQKIEASATNPHALRIARFHGNRWTALTDVNALDSIMSTYPDYRQIISLAAPPIEYYAPPDIASELARTANEEIASLVANFPDRFLGFVASLPLNDTDASIREAEYAVFTLGAVGVQLFTNVNGIPLDHPSFLPLFDFLAHHQIPAWIHPWRDYHTTPDYPSETRSRFMIAWSLGWPYETGACMVRLTLSGILERYPQLSLITHHMGGIVPPLASRLSDELSNGRFGWQNPDDAASLQTLTRRPLDYLRTFYADTATFGGTCQLRCGLEFFGCDRILFATDYPFDLEGGTYNVRETLRAIEELGLSAEEQRKIFSENILRITASLPSRQ